jgi:hypothetical protein
MKTQLLILSLLLFCFITNCLAVDSFHPSGQVNSTIPSFLKHHNEFPTQSNDFVNTPTSLASKDRPNISILANGSEITTINAGQDIVLTVTFSSGVSQATFTQWVDVNANHTLQDNIDVLIDSPITIIDNDFNDQNPATGVYQGTMSGSESGPNTVANLYILYSVVDAGGSDVASVHVLPVVSAYSIAGSVTPAMATLIIMASPIDNMSQNYMTATNSDGTYILYVPVSYHYSVQAFDPVNVTGGLISQTTYSD